MRWLLFLLIVFVAGDRLGGWFLGREATGSQFRYARLYDGRAGAGLLLVGNSRGLPFYEPYIAEKTGRTTFNLSYNGMPANLAEALVLDYLDRYPAPATMLVDITLCDRPNNELINNMLCYADRSPRLSALIREQAPKLWWAGQVSALTRYNSEVFQRALYHRRKTDKDWLLDRTISPALAATVGSQSYDLTVSPELVGHLANFVAAARSKGVAVRLVIGPYFPGFQVKNLDALQQAVEQATGLPVEDYRNALQDAALFGDFMHVNKKGVVAYLDLLLAKN